MHLQRFACERRSVQINLALRSKKCMLLHFQQGVTPGSTKKSDGKSSGRFVVWPLLMSLWSQVTSFKCTYMYRSCAISTSCLHCASAAGAEWEAYHRSCREKSLWCLRVCGHQHCGGEGEQGSSALCAGWDRNWKQLITVLASLVSNAMSGFQSNITLCKITLCKFSFCKQNTLIHAKHSFEFLFCCTAAKPVLVLKPENVSVRAGESAQFYCQAKGDPPPAVVWSREQGPLPNGR